MKKLLLLLFISILMVACNTSDNVSTNICTVTTYKTEAQPIMNEFGRTIKDVSLRDHGEVQAAIDKMETLLAKTKTVQCREKYPLKHETLEYAIRHMIDAFEYVLAEDLIEMQRSINKSELNVNQFNNWNVDVGP